jgi:hypothetical protein
VRLPIVAAAVAIPLFDVIAVCRAVRAACI